MGTAEERVRRITEAVLSLPVLPTITAKVIELVDHPKTSASLLANLVSKDQVLTARVLKLANSSFYALRHEVNTVKQAVVVMGTNSIREMSLSLAVFNIFRSDPESPHFNVAEFWKHCIAVGLGTQYIARELRFTDAGVAFTAGLLHDIGKLVLHHYLPVEFNHVQEMIARRGMPQDQAERLTWGVGHEQVGYWLARKWRLPDRLTEAIAYHHAPWEAPSESMLCHSVYAADYLVTHAKIGHRGTAHTGTMADERRQDLMEMFGVDEERFYAWEEAILEEYQLKASDLISEAVAS